MFNKKDEILSEEVVTNYLYVIYDRIADDSGPVFQAKNDEVACRQVVRTLASTWNPQDYQLLRIGKVESNGQAVLLPVSLHIVDVEPTLQLYKDFIQEQDKKGRTDAPVSAVQLIKEQMDKENE